MINNMEEQFEYELIGFLAEPESTTSCTQMVYDETEPLYGPIEYDENGIPKGSTMEEIKKRQELVKEFFNEWLKNNPDANVVNDSLDDKIYVRPVSIGEAMEHSSKSYLSTVALKHLSEILQKARPVGRVPIKIGNRRQSRFEYMLIMAYELPQIGKIKLTIGIMKKTEERVEYGVTVLREGDVLINRKRKAPHKK